MFDLGMGGAAVSRGMTRIGDAVMAGVQECELSGLFMHGRRHDVMVEMVW